MSNNQVLVIIASGEREKALTAMTYAWNTKKQGWLDDVKVMFFGPSENLLLEDEEVAREAGKLAEIMEPIACKFLADRDSLTEGIEKMGMKLEYVGSEIAELIKKGYTPMVW